MSALRLDHVTLTLGRRTILQDVSFAVEDSEFIGVLGPNGAGKTTLFRAILGLIPVTSGTIAAPGNRAIGYMPQTRAVAAGLRVCGADFVAGAASGHRWGLPTLSKADRRDVAWALDLVGATALARRPLSELSGGERQRLLLAQAVLGRPKVLLLDEPLISLDPHHQQAVVALVKELQQELKIAVLFSAHELNPLLGALDRVLYLGGGQAALGPVDEVITGPVLSRLYGSLIEVFHLKGRIFVMGGGMDMEHDAHGHGHDEGHRHDDGHGHGHRHDPSHASDHTHTGDHSLNA